MVGVFFRRNMFSLLFGALGGSLLVGGPFADAALSWWDDQNPVWADPRLQVVEHSTGVLVVDLWARKVRACAHRRISAHAKRSDDPYQQLTIERVDKPMVGMTRPVGVQYVGRYRLTTTPPKPFDAVIVNENECSGRLVVSTLAEVSMR